MVYDEAIPIMCDNTSAINISKNLVMHSRTKHISIWYHFIKGEGYKKGSQIEVYFYKRIGCRHFH